MKEVLKSEIVIDRKKIKPGTPISQLPAGTVASLRMANMIAIAGESDEPPSDETPPDDAGSGEANPQPTARKTTSRKTTSAKTKRKSTSRKSKTEASEPQADPTADGTPDDADPDNAIAVDALGLDDETTAALTAGGIETLGDIRKHFADAGNLADFLSDEQNTAAVESLGL
ncbi:hypothetical protein [Roseiconus lacunae]|uniref:hypothetical protein n=1 Tax=Roseiconus lacunae TaxID=2605694 RepID=UPI0011F35078|nr:hypothetical protein [Roseiconus lacunae]